MSEPIVQVLSERMARQEERMNTHQAKFESALNGLQADLAVRDSIRDASMAKCEAYMSEHRSILDKMRSDMARRDAETAERDARRDAETAERDARRDAETAERDARRDAAMAERDARHGEEMAKRDVETAKRDAETAKRDARRDAEMAVRDAEIAKRDAERDARLDRREKDTLRWQFGMMISAVIVIVGILGIVIRWPS